MSIQINFRPNKQNSKGYSLIEIIFVIAVTAILAGISVPSLINWKYFQNIKTRQLALKTNLEQIKSNAKRWGATCTINGRTLKSSCTSAVLQKSITDTFNLETSQEIIIKPTIYTRSDADEFTATNFNKITFTPRGFIHIDPIYSKDNSAVFVLGYKSDTDQFKNQAPELCVVVENLTGRISIKRRESKTLGRVQTKGNIYAKSALPC